MNRKEKALLRDAFAVPEPVKKEAFLRQISAPSISGFEFAAVQLTYLRRRAWIPAALLLALALIGANYPEKDLLWCVSAFMPPLALHIVTESGRSELFGMAELELSTRFSLKSVLLARLGIIGAADLLFICLLIPLIFSGGRGTLLQTGFCVLCPYLLTISLGLRVTRKFRGKEASYLCTGIAAVVSAVCIILPRTVPALYLRQSEPGWSAAFALLCVGAARQCVRTIRQTEELAWNL